MSKIFTGLKRLYSRRNYIKAFGILLLVFAIDSLIGSYDVLTEPTYYNVGSIDSIEDKADLILWYDNQSAWLENNYHGDIAKSLYTWFPYIFLLLFYYNRKFFFELKLDVFDKLAAGVCLFSSVITFWDYLTNYNLRSQLLDWQSVGGVLLVLFCLKLYNLSR